jgi:hypothetical protein
LNKNAGTGIIFPRTRHKSKKFMLLEYNIPKYSLFGNLRAGGISNPGSLSRTSSQPFFCLNILGRKLPGWRFNHSAIPANLILYQFEAIFLLVGVYKGFGRNQYRMEWLAFTDG